MEDNTKALEVVCKHFKHEFGDDAISRLRRPINRAHVANHRLRKQLIRLQEILDIERSLKGIFRSMLITVTEVANEI